MNSSADYVVYICDLPDLCMYLPLYFQLFDEVPNFNMPLEACGRGEYSRCKGFGMWNYGLNIREAGLLGFEFRWWAS